jgi:hypothetical protein
VIRRWLRSCLHRPAAEKLAILTLPRDGLPLPHPDTACWLWLRGKLRGDTHPQLQSYLVQRAAFHLSKLAPVLGSVRALTAAGHEALLLKGAALLAAGHVPMGSREMGDFDILVRDVPGALQVLRERGWTVRYPERREHSVDLIHEREGKLDLHSRSLYESGHDEGLWERSAVSDFLGLRCRVPAATDLLLQLCIHGYRRGGSRPRWVCDAGSVLAARSGEIDWGLLAREAETRRVGFALKATLEYLAEMGIPTGALPRIRTVWWEPLEFCIRSGLGPENRFRRSLMPALDYLRGDRSLLSILARRARAVLPMRDGRADGHRA